MRKLLNMRIQFARTHSQSIYVFEQQIRCDFWHLMLCHLLTLTRRTVHAMPVGRMIDCPHVCVCVYLCSMMWFHPIVVYLFISQFHCLAFFFIVQPPEQTNQRNINSDIWNFLKTINLIPESRQRKESKNIFLVKAHRAYASCIKNINLINFPFRDGENHLMAKIKTILLVSIFFFFVLFRFRFRVTGKNN